VTRDGESVIVRLGSIYQIRLGLRLDLDLGFAVTLRTIADFPNNELKSSVQQCFA